jgi:NADPH:quinone reductase-like Zn-dependent oxidoreductase
VKAIVQDRYGSPDVLELREIDTPAVKDDGLLVRVRAAGVDPSVWHLMTGQPYLMRLMGFGLRKPRNRIRGWDVAGQVETVGTNVKRFRPGDEVFGSCRGAFAEYVSAPEDRFVLKPANLTFAQAAAVPVSALTALQALRDRGEIQPGQGVLIIGAGGGVGTFAVQIAKALGASVTGVCSTTKTELVRSLGADHVIDYTREDFTEGQERYDLIVDMAGNRPLSRLRRVLSPRGTIVMVGGESAGRWTGGLHHLLWATLLSAFVRQRFRPFLAQVRNKDLDFLKELIEAGKVMPVIDRTYPLGQVPDAVRYLAEGHARGKVVITL